MAPRFFGLCTLFLWPWSGIASTPASVDVFFSPKGGAADAVVKQIGSATNRVLVQAYFLTSKPISESLVKAKRKGVEVSIILDRSQATEKYSAADYFANAGVPVRIDSEHAIAHNKVMVIDDSMVITGSFNFTNSAEDQNAENLVILRSRELAVRYTENWMLHFKHSKDYSRKVGTGLQNAGK